MTAPTQTIPAAPFTPILPKGYILGEYKIESVRGQGNFGITYSATELMTNYPVVIKENYPSDFAYRDPITGELRPKHDKDDDYQWALKSFEKEARTLRKLPIHPNIVHVTGVIRALNTAYIVMEPVSGQNLHKLYTGTSGTTGRQMEAQLLESILRKLLSAMISMHSREIIHRDIKPANIMLTPAGEPVLIDFGAARPIQGTHHATQIGTRGYAPPEQMEVFEDEEDGEKQPPQPQPHWDLYALGCTCHQLITGRAPIHGSRQLTGRTELAGKYPARLLSSIDKAREIDPANRWQSAQDWLDELTADERAAQEEARKNAETTAANLQRQLKNAAQGNTGKRRSYGGCLIISLLLLAASGALNYHQYQYAESLSTQTENVKNELMQAEEKVRKAEEAQQLAEKKAAEAEEARQLAENEKLATEIQPLLLKLPEQEARERLQKQNISQDQYNNKLLQAADEGKTELLELLITAGADVNTTRANGQTPLYMAAWKGHADCVRALLSVKGINVNPAHKEYEQTPLYMAAWKGHADCVRALLSVKGIDVNLAHKEYGQTPLYTAAWKGHADCVRALLSVKGINVNAADQYGRTPLYTAAMHGHADCVRALLSVKGIDVNLAHKEHKQTPLFMAAWKGHADCVRALLSVKGIDLDKKSIDGWTARSIAEKEGKTECFNLLKAAGAK
ncbi:MAG: ankyrin repeat domain-containing protein [Akkermansia sp.]|nr:ankyrin repeat domain-containing protein [Akkermansia sp.]